MLPEMITLSAIPSFARIPIPNANFVLPPQQRSLANFLSIIIASIVFQVNLEVSVQCVYIWSRYRCTYRIRQGNNLVFNIQCILHDNLGTHSLIRLGLIVITVADLWGGGLKFFLMFMQFSGKICQVVCWCPLLRGWCPAPGKSWIHH